MTRFALLALVLLAACATAQPYAQSTQSDGTGWSQTAIETDRYRVRYVGARGDSAERVQDYALLRAAELTLEQGYDWFEVTSRTAESQAHAGAPRFSLGVGGATFGSHTSTGVGVGFGVPLGRSGGAWTTAGLEIRLGRGAKPDQANAYDAHQVQTMIRARM